MMSFMSYIPEKKILCIYYWQLYEKRKPNQHVYSGYIICEPPSNGIIVFKITGACKIIFFALSLFYSANSKM